MNDAARPSSPPATRLAPTRLAPDTYLIHHHEGEGTAPVVVALNSMVIRGREPIVVDTGVVAHREQYRPDHRRVLGVGCVRRADAHARHPRRRDRSGDVAPWHGDVQQLPVP